MLYCGETEEHFRLLFEAAPNGMIVTDHDGVITFVNRRAEKLFGYWRGELIGRSVDVLVLLCHKFLGRDRLAMGTAQHGHRGRVLTRAAMRRRRMVAIEFGTWRSGRSGGSAGSVTVGCAKFLEHPGGTRC